MVIVGKSQTIPKTAIKFIKENVNIATEKLNLTLKDHIISIAIVLVFGYLFNAIYNFILNR